MELPPKVRLVTEALTTRLKAYLAQGQYHVARRDLCPDKESGAMEGSVLCWVFLLR
jgi:hypothetical protein